jgi:dTDP-glucose pyrophosphorylase
MSDHTGSFENWRHALLPPSATVQEVIQNLDMVAIQIVLITDEDGRLVGTISDGDIRRGLLRGLTLESSIESIIFRKPLVVPSSLDRNMVLQLMTANQIRQIPIIDEDNRIIGIHLWNQVATPAERSNTLVIMAGGKGLRMRPYTETCPKPMLPIQGKPMLEHILDRARLEGFHRFVFAIHYLGHIIEEYFGTGEKWGVQIDYLREDSPLGTAGALSLLSKIPEEPVVVTNGDVITDIRYAELLSFHERHGATATMAVRLHEWQHPFGVVQLRGLDIVGFEEKPIARSHINAGIYVLAPAALRALGKGVHCDMPALFEKLHAQSLRTVAYPMHEPWLDVGRPGDLTKMNE